MPVVTQPTTTDKTRNYITSTIKVAHTDGKHNIKATHQTAKEEVKTPNYYITLLVVYLRYNVFN